MACPFDNPYEESALPRPVRASRLVADAVFGSVYAGMRPSELASLPVHLLQDIFEDGYITRRQFKVAAKVRRITERVEAAARVRQASLR